MHLTFALTHALVIYVVDLGTRKETSCNVCACRSTEHAQNWRVSTLERATYQPTCTVVEEWRVSVITWTISPPTPLAPRFDTSINLVFLATKSREAQQETVATVSPTATGPCLVLSSVTNLKQFFPSSTSALAFSLLSVAWECL